MFTLLTYLVLCEQCGGAALVKVAVDRREGDECAGVSQCIDFYRVLAEVFALIHIQRHLQEYEIVQRRAGTFLCYCNNPRLFLLHNMVTKAKNTEQARNHHTSKHYFVVPTPDYDVTLVPRLCGRP